ncbi:MAG: substrate-binding domain-containing protein [Bacteroidales bacterium]|nr:substrate-binding domain-containing protein [Bacteroidales bacterium]
MRLTNLLLILFIVPLSALILISCADNRKYRIGVSQCSQDDWRSKMNDEIRREVMFNEDVEVEIRSADDDNDRQAADIRYFADNGFDMLIVSPNEAAALTPVIKDVYERGMPVIIFDRNIIGDTYTARIGVDNEGLGRSAAHYALHMLGRGAKAIEIYGLRGSTPAEGRHDGFVSEFEAGGGRMLASVAADWNKEDAIVVADSLLRVYDDVDLIYAHNDRMAIGASEVARRLGRDSIRIIGIDAAPNIGIKAVADSVIDATFLYPTEGQRIIRTALSILRGEPYEREVMLPVSSAVDLSNADILLLQNEALNEETGKMRILKTRIDDYWAQHSSQTSLFYASIVIIVLLFGVVFLVLRAFWQHKRHQAALIDRNRELEQERDKQKLLNERLQEATRSKLMFFTNVSHDLRTPLTLISEPVAQLAAADNLTSQQQTLIKIADKNVRILRRLINQILDFRKYENDKLTLSLGETDLGKAVGEWAEAFVSLARKRHMRLAVDAPADGSVTLAVDTEKIERVFFNLVSNAFKYTPDNGSITITCRIDGDRAVITVADTGEGISSRDLGNIFDRFYQVDRVHPDGSGIGLSVSKAFVELHGGTIAVESEPGRGSVFTVTLPVRHVEAHAADIAATITADEVDAELDTIDSDIEFDDAKPIVLVIDDNKDIQRMLAQLLSADYNVITASNGADGLHRAARYVPDLIICDVMMPVMDGLECCRRIKSEVTTSHIPVLMLTACSMDEQRVQGYDSGADGYLAKPFDSSVLRSRCASLIANRRRIEQLWRSTGKTAQPAPKETRKPVSDIDSEFYNRFLEIFSAEMGNPETNVDSLAARMGLERSQFYRKIKALTNYSPVELMRTIRLNRARQLLVSTDKTISEIAYQIGFSTPAYFTKCYRDAFGETPSDVRARL